MRLANIWPLALCLGCFAAESRPFEGSDGLGAREKNEVEALNFKGSLAPDEKESLLILERRSSPYTLLTSLDKIDRRRKEAVSKVESKRKPIARQKREKPIKGILRLIQFAQRGLSKEGLPYEDIARDFTQWIDRSGDGNARDGAYPANMRLFKFALEAKEFPTQKSRKFVEAFISWWASWRVQVAERKKFLASKLAALKSHETDAPANIKERAPTGFAPVSTKGTKTLAPEHTKPHTRKGFRHASRKGTKSPKSLVDTTTAVQ